MCFCESVPDDLEERKHINMHLKEKNIDNMFTYLCIDHRHAQDLPRAVICLFVHLRVKTRVSAKTEVAL
jgi:hypothetical protein